MSDYCTYKAVCIGRIAASVKLSLYWGAWTKVGVWVPKSLLGPDNEVNSTGDRGKAQIKKWWCVQELLEPRLELKASKRPLAVQRTIDMVLLILDKQAQALNHNANRIEIVEEAICECGVCYGDPIAWHQGDMLRTTIGLLKESLDA